MTPSSFKWHKVIRDNWFYYKVGSDEFTYSIEPSGIQMTFNDETPFLKAKTIADEVMRKMKAIGQKPTLLIIDSNGTAPIQFIKN